MSSLGIEPNPQMQSGVGGAGLVYAPPTDDPNYFVNPIQGFGVPTNYGLPNNLTLGPANPLGQYTDDQYLADDASLRQQLGTQYTDILRQLGFQDPNTGHVIPGSVVQDANIKLSQYQEQLQQALRDNVSQMLQNGTLFSGYRATDLAQRQLPTQQGIGQLQLDTSRSLSDLYNQAQGLVQNYNTHNQQSLAAAAARNLQRIGGNQLTGPDTSPEGTPLPTGFSYESHGQGIGYHPTDLTGNPHGTYTPGGGSTYYQSHQGPYGYKPLV